MVALILIQQAHFISCVVLYIFSVTTFILRSSSHIIPQSMNCFLYVCIIIFDSIIAEVQFLHEWFFFFLWTYRDYSVLFLNSSPGFGPCYLTVSPTNNNFSFSIFSFCFLLNIPWHFFLPLANTKLLLIQTFTLKHHLSQFSLDTELHLTNWTFFHYL